MPSKHQIVMIMTDTTRFDMVGCYGFPAMEGVANNGVLKGAAASAGNVKMQTFIPALNDLNLELCTLAQAVTVSHTNVDDAIATFKKNVATKVK